MGLVFMPAAKAAKAYKFTRPFYGPYRVATVYDTGLEVRPVDRPQENPIRIAFDRVRHCPEELADTFWPRRACAKKPPGKGPENLLMRLGTTGCRESPR